MGNLVISACESRMYMPRWLCVHIATLDPSDLMGRGDIGSAGAGVFFPCVIAKSYHR